MDERQDDDLWGDLPDISKFKLPEDVLNQQANLLSQKTRGVLVGEVRRIESKRHPGEFYGSSDNYDIEWSLEIRVPRMDNYTFQLLIVRHDVHLYPAHVLSTASGWESTACQNTGELREVLRSILRHDDMRTIIGSLLAQGTDPRDRARPKPNVPNVPDDDIPF